MERRCEEDDVFCQAEDGIRDIGVTGVQTCALPIWGKKGARAAAAAEPAGGASGDRRPPSGGPRAAARPLSALPTLGHSSEERRVGKECRCRWSPHHSQKSYSPPAEERATDTHHHSR